MTTPVADLTTFREWVLSNTSKQFTTEEKEKLLSDETVVSSFMAATSPYESKTWPNDMRWDWPASVFASVAANLIHENKAMLDKIASLQDGTQTYANTLGAMHDEARMTQAIGSSMSMLSEVSPSKEVRDAANAAKETLSAYGVEASSRLDVFQSIKKFSQSDEAKSLTGEKKRYLEHTMRDFRRDGLDLPKDKMDELIELRKKMSALQIKFHSNVSEEKTAFEFTEEQLFGMSKDQLANLKTKEVDGVKYYIVDLKTPNYVPVMQYCRVEETRKKMEFAYNSRCIKENSPIIEEIVSLRSKEAKLLGYATHADYALEVRMAKKTDVVIEFLESLSDKLEPLYERDVAALMKIKEEDCKTRNIPFDGKINPWDRALYSRLYEEKVFSIDHEAIKQHFPLENVLKGMFDIYSSLLHLRFEIFTAKDGINVYHEDVTLVKVYDEAPGPNKGKIIGHGFFDLHPREGKYSHAAVFPLISSCLDDKNERVLPVAALVCNFPQGTADKPALMPHSDVVTMLHEAGHWLHHILSQAEIIRFSGTSVALDFVEAPSQMLENFCIEKESLDKLMSKPLAPEMYDALKKSKSGLTGLFNKRQLVFGLSDMQLHGRVLKDDEKIDSAQVYSDVMQRVQHSLPTPGTNMIASFGHIASHYAAGYYGYLWAEVFALDMFYSRFLKDGVLNPDTGLEYRRFVLERGSTEDADILLERFLKRKPNQDAFLKIKGL